MPENNNNPRRRIVKFNFSFSWFYLLLIFGIGYMLMNQKQANPQKLEWAEVESIIRDGDVKEINFVRNDYRGTVTVRPDRIAKYADKWGGHPHCQLSCHKSLSPNYLCAFKSPPNKSPH